MRPSRGLGHLMRPSRGVDRGAMVSINDNMWCDNNINITLPMVIKKLYGSSEILNFLEIMGPFIGGTSLFDSLHLKGLYKWAPGVGIPDLFFGWGCSSFRKMIISLESLFLTIMGLDSWISKKDLEIWQ